MTTALVRALLVTSLLALAACGADSPLTPAQGGGATPADATFRTASPAGGHDEDHGNDHSTPRSFLAHLTGDPAGVETRARGNAVFQVAADRESLSYRLIVANSMNVEMAHIHMAPMGEDGPPVVWLYPDAPPAQLIEGRSSGVLMTGTATADDLVGPLEGMTFDDLLTAMMEGRTYVNVHTTEHPSGEIRGHIETAGRGRSTP